MFRTLRLKPLLALLVAGVIAGLAAWEFVLRSYEARFSLSADAKLDLASFRQAEAGLRSADHLRKYGAARKLSADPAFQRLERQLVTNAAGPVRIEHTFRAKKRDFRDVPDSLAKEGISKQEAASLLVSDILVAATASDPHQAVKKAKLAMEYLRESLHLTSLRSSVQTWGPNARVELVGLREQIAGHRATLASLDRRLVSLAVVRERYKDLRELATISPTSVQVQVTGQRNLSPLHQVLGLEVERVEVVELIKLADENRARLETLEKFAAAFAPRLDGSEPAAAIEGGWSTGLRRRSRNPMPRMPSPSSAR